MTKDKSMNALTGIVEILTPLSSDERARIFRAAMVLLGEAQPAMGDGSVDGLTESLNSLPPRARAWMKQNSITLDELHQVFHFGDGTVEFIATLPGRNKKEQTLNGYIISGIGQLFLNGNTSFDDKIARALCERSGCYDMANHSAILKDRGNEFAGTKERGWTLTAPGLKRGAEIIKLMNKPN